MNNTSTAPTVNATSYEERRGRATAEMNRKAAQEFAEALSSLLYDVLCQVEPTPLWDWRATRIARELDRRGVLSREGGSWSGVTVRRLIQRLPHVSEAALQFWGAKIKARHAAAFGSNAGLGK